MKTLLVSTVFLQLVSLGAVGCRTSGDKRIVDEDTSGADDATDALADANDPFDSVEDTLDSGVTDGVVTVDGGTVDADAEDDALDCAIPAEGCACDPALGSRPCCIRGSVGLLCSAFFKEWGRFYDCGCSESPDCAGYPLYQLCQVQYHP